MVRLVVFLLGIAVVASGLSWLADRPGSLIVNWQGYEFETSVFRAVVLMALIVGIAIVLWSIGTALWRSPASIGMFFNRRRQMRGLEALSAGMIAIGAGDRDAATRSAVQARKALPNEPLTHLLRAQAAQLSGDRATSRRMFEAMLTQPETEQLGLRGLFLEAEREGEKEAARQFAERSVELNPRLAWAVDALFDLQCREHDWAGALETLTIAKKHQHHAKAGLERRRAVLMTARAQALEETEPNRAMNLAVEAHHLSHDLVPAAVLAGRMLAARGQTKRAAKIVERTWRRHPHPDLAVIYAHARIGDSPTDRLTRVKRLGQLNPHSIETPLAIATAAIDAKDWDLARGVLERLDASRITQRVCMLMARVEGEQSGDKGRVREWLARAVHAPRDPAWVADGVVSEKWAPVSPVTGSFDTYQWKVPADALDAADTAALAAKLEELVKLGTPDLEPAIKPVASAAVIVKDVTPAVVQKASAARSDVAAVPSRSRDAEDVTASTNKIAPAAAGGTRPLRVDEGAGKREPAPQRATSARVSDVDVVSPAVEARIASGSMPATRVKAEPGKVADVAAVEAKVAGEKKLAGTGDGAGKPQASAGERQPLEPAMFIAPKPVEEKSDKPAASAEEPIEVARVIASGQR